ncbi:MAG: hypothetical protein JWQ38_1979 [Flavipsychrobacter sp.]|nr:hypothetical protein [Flavipsychrobacter sp.]
MDNDQKILLGRITTNPGIFGGKPIIRGLRFRVIDVLEMMASGMTAEQILEEHPILEADDINACLLYASMIINDSPIVHAA